MSRAITISYAVVIPAFNAARTLRDAIESVLRQTIQPTAIIVVDDGSTDETAAIAVSFGDRVTLVTQTNQGPAAATDRGIGLAQAVAIAGLDADDIWFPDKAERQLSRLAARTDLDAVFCRSVSFRHGDAPDAAGPARDSWSRSAMMVRRAAADRLGPILDPDNPRSLGEMIRWLDLGRRRGLNFELMPDVLVGRRIIEGSLSFPRDPRALLPLVQAKLANRSRARLLAAAIVDRSEP